MDISNKTTVKQLIGMGVTLEQIKGLVLKSQRKSNKAQVSEERLALMEEVYTLMVSDPTQKWKNGMILKNWFEGPSKDDEVEKARRAKHAEISRALSQLAEDGRITKVAGEKSASSTYYTVPAALIQVDDSDVNDEVETPQNEE